MLNNQETYRTVGYAAAKACKNGDMARFKFEINHFRRMQALEDGQDKAKAETAFNEGYREGR